MPNRCFSERLSLKSAVICDNNFPWELRESSTQVPFHFSTLLVHSAVPGTASLAYTCMTYMHDKERIPLIRGTFRALPLERLNFVESRATDENSVRNLGISHIGLLNRCVSSVV